MFFARVNAPVHGVRRPPPPFPARCRVPSAAPAEIPRPRSLRPPGALRLSASPGLCSKRHGSAGAAGGADTAVAAVTISRQSRRARLPQRRAREGAGAYTQLSPGLSTLSSGREGCVHPQKCQGQGGFWTPSPQGQRRCRRGDSPVVQPQPGAQEEVTEGRVWPADVSQAPLTDFRGQPLLWAFINCPFWPGERPCCSLHTVLN